MQQINESNEEVKAVDDYDSDLSEQLWDVDDDVEQEESEDEGNL